jgi:hypothetical protein
VGVKDDRVGVNKMNPTRPPSPCGLRRATSPFQGEVWHRPCGDTRAHAFASHRLFWIGTFMSSILSSRTSSGMPQATAGSDLILKWYMLWSA